MSWQKTWPTASYPPVVIHQYVYVPPSSTRSTGITRKPLPRKSPHIKSPSPLFSNKSNNLISRPTTASKPQSQLFPATKFKIALLSTSVHSAQPVPASITLTTARILSLRSVILLQGLLTSDCPAIRKAVSKKLVLPLTFLGLSLYRILPLLRRITEAFFELNHS